MQQLRRSYTILQVMVMVIPVIDTMDKLDIDAQDRTDVKEVSFDTLSEWLDVSFPYFPESVRTDMFLGVRWILRILVGCPELVGKLAYLLHEEDEHMLGRSDVIWRRIVTNETRILMECYKKHAEEEKDAPTSAP